MKEMQIQRCVPTLAPIQMYLWKRDAEAIAVISRTDPEGIEEHLDGGDKERNIQ
jgi:hypothetical protein